MKPRQLEDHFDPMNINIDYIEEKDQPKAARFVTVQKKAKRAKKDNPASGLEAKRKSKQTSSLVSISKTSNHVAQNAQGQYLTRIRMRNLSYSSV